MAGKQNKPYVKLPGRGIRGWIAAVSYTSLWMGSDHLMQVEGNRFSEDYKRFYFKDIKAIIIRRTKTWATTNWSLLGLAVFFIALFGAFAATAPRADRGGFVITGGCLAVFFLFVAAINLLLGPTCVCHLRTPVQEEELPSLKRLRNARKALQRIRAAVEAVQGPFTENERQEIAVLIAKYEGLPVESITRETGQVPPALPNATSKNLRWNMALIVTLLVCAVMEFFSIGALPGAFSIYLNATANFALGGIAIAMLVRLPKGAAKEVAWARVVIWGFWRAVGTVYGAIAGFHYALKHPGEPTDLVKVMQFLPKSYFIAMGISAAMYLIWAVLEIIALHKANKQLASQAAKPTAVTAPTDLY